MAESVSGLNPDVLKWARKTSGFSLDEVAASFKKNVDVIRSWESGEDAPTYVQLETLAYRLYKRPVAIFFFPEPPLEPDPKQSFRTLPDFEIENLSADTLYALRQARAMQLALGEINDGVNPSENKLFRDIDASVDIDLVDLTSRVREYIGVRLQEQLLWRRRDEALGNWRNAIEERGIFIFKRSFKQRDVSGFSLLDDEFPVIYINNGTSVSRQIFTLFHELGHLLLQTNGITFRSDQYITYLEGNDKEIEIFCNRFASEFLVPSTDFNRRLSRDRRDDDHISSIADLYKVSREVILRKMLDRGIVNREYYELKANQWIEEYERESGGRKGGNYYATQAAYLGEKYLRLAFSRYYQGRCTIEQLADYLNVKVKSVTGLEEIALKKASPL